MTQKTDVYECDVDRCRKQTADESEMIMIDDRSGGVVHHACSAGHAEQFISRMGSYTINGDTIEVDATYGGELHERILNDETIEDRWSTVFTCLFSTVFAPLALISMVFGSLDNVSSEYDRMLFRERLVYASISVGMFGFGLLL